MCPLVGRCACACDRALDLLDDGTELHDQVVGAAERDEARHCGKVSRTTGVVGFVSKNTRTCFYFVSNKTIFESSSAAVYFSSSAAVYFSPSAAAGSSTKTHKHEQIFVLEKVD